MKQGDLILCHKNKYHVSDGTTLQFIKGKFYRIYYVAVRNIYIIDERGILVSFLKSEIEPIYRHENSFEDYFYDISELDLSQIIILMR